MSDEPELVDLTQDEVVKFVDLTQDDAVNNDGDNNSSIQDVILEPQQPLQLRRTRRRKINPSAVITLDDSLSIIRPIQPPSIPKTINRRLSPPSPPPNALKCPICIETFTEVKQRGLKIVVTKCGHLFCDFCLKKAIKDNGRKCPKCRKSVPKGVAGIIEIFDVC